MGDELLSRAYNFRQQESEEVSAFASRLDNQIRKAKNHGAELLPDEEAVDLHLRLLFWQGLKESMKDKARHKKDSCKTFADLISAARYGEKEASLAQFSRRVVRQNMIYGTEVSQSDGPPERLSQVCSAMAREVREALQPLTNSRSVATGGNVPGSGVSSGYGMDSLELPTCYRCGQKGHLRRGCRNPPIGSNSFEQSGNGNGPLMRGSKPEAVTQEQPHPVLDALIGDANECVAYLNGHPRLALLDTGSQVTSISEQEVPFLGYVELDVSFPRTEAGIDNIFQTHVLVVTDSFMKNSWAFPTRNQQAPTVVKLFWEKILVNFGFPQRLHSDQGRDFESRMGFVQSGWN